jgi:hypothetical protein
LLFGGDDGFQFLLSALLAVGAVGCVGCGVGDLLCFLDGGLFDVGSIHFRKCLGTGALQLAGSGRALSSRAVQTRRIERLAVLEYLWLASSSNARVAVGGRVIRMMV